MHMSSFTKTNLLILTRFLREMLRLILQEISFQFIGKNYLQTHGTAMGTKMAVAFVNIYMAAIETKILSQSHNKPLEWKRYIDVLAHTFGNSSGWSRPILGESS